VARVLRGDIYWADLNPAKGRASDSELAQLVEGLLEILGE